MRRFDLTKEFELAGTGFVLQGQDIRNHLSGCRQVYLMAATVGQGTEKAVSLAQKKSAHEALLLDTAASCAIESYCDDICEDLQERLPYPAYPPLFLRVRRFSAGSTAGDLRYPAHRFADRAVL